MRLNHFTSWHHYVGIKLDGEILTSESSIGSIWPDCEPYGEHVAPDVVWLTRRDDVSRNGVVLPEDPVFLPLAAKKIGCPLIELNKGLIRLTVDVPDAHHWPEWSRRHGIHPKMYRWLARDGSVPEAWYVVERPIAVQEIVETRIDPELLAHVVQQSHRLVDETGLDELPSGHLLTSRPTIDGPPILVQLALHHGTPEVILAPTG